jgi:hypothetical protein
MNWSVATSLAPLAFTQQATQLAAVVELISIPSRGALILKKTRPRGNRDAWTTAAIAVDKPLTRRKIVIPNRTESSRHNVSPCYLLTWICEPAVSIL